jgi:hypothetical protein
MHRRRQPTGLAHRTGPYVARRASLGLGRREAAGISIAAQLSHATAGRPPQHLYIHQLPKTASWVAGLIERILDPAARDTLALSATRRLEGNRRETRPIARRRQPVQQPRFRSYR